MALYPIMLNIKDRRCVVIGGGDVAERKVNALVEAGARVVVISPRLTENLQRLVDAEAIEHYARAYQQGDLVGAFLAVVATNDERTNIASAEEAHSLGIPVNVVDRPDLCSFIVPAIVRRDSLIIAISTSGASPALSARLKSIISEALPEGIEQVLGFLENIRTDIINKVKDPEKRKSLFEKATSSEMLRILKQKGPEAAIVYIKEVLETEK